MARIVSWGRPCSSVQVVREYCVRLLLGSSAKDGNTADITRNAAAIEARMGLMKMITCRVRPPADGATLMKRTKRAYALQHLSERYARHHEACTRSHRNAADRPGYGGAAGSQYAISDPADEPRRYPAGKGSVRHSPAGG